MTTVKLYVHKYLGCLCAYNVRYGTYQDDEEYSIYLYWLKELLYQAPECWELIDEWDETEGDNNGN
jgi:hypothetical protein